MQDIKEFSAVPIFKLFISLSNENKMSVFPAYINVNDIFRLSIGPLTAVSQKKVVIGIYYYGHLYITEFLF